MFGIGSTLKKHSKSILGGVGADYFSGVKMPRAPKPGVLADTQLGYNKDAAFGSLINQNGPFGSLNYTKNPDGTFNANTSLDPAGQRAVGGAREGAGNMLAEFLAGGDGRQRTEDAIYGRYTSRLNPEWDERERATLSRLETQGITQGSKAYNDAMDRLSRERSTAYDDARTSAVLGGSAERTARMGEIGSMFNLGQLFNTPQAVGHAGIGAPDFMGAAMGTYNAKLKAASAENAARAQLLSSIISGGSKMVGAPG